MQGSLSKQQHFRPASLPIVEYTGEVYRIDRCNKSRSKAAKQVTAKPHMPWSCRFHLIINIKLILIKIVYIYNYYKHHLAAHESATSRTLVVFYPRARRYTSAGNSDRTVCPFVCPSVTLSVTRRCCQNEQS